MKTKLFTFLFLLSVLFGCSTGATNSGGAAKTSWQKQQVTTFDQEGKPEQTTTTEKVNMDGRQPDDPSSPTEFTSNIGENTFKVELPATIKQMPFTPVENSMGMVIIIAGVGILAGGAVAAFLSIKAGLIISGLSAATLAVVAVISEAKPYLAILLVGGAAVVLVFGVFALRSWWMDKKSLNQTESAIEEIKKDPETWEKVKNKLKEFQDEDVKEKIKNKRKRRP